MDPTIYPPSAAEEDWQLKLVSASASKAQLGSAPAFIDFGFDFSSEAGKCQGTVSVRVPANYVLSVRTLSHASFVGWAYAMVASHLSRLAAAADDHDASVEYIAQVDGTKTLFQWEELGTTQVDDLLPENMNGDYFFPESLTPAAW